MTDERAHFIKAHNEYLTPPSTYEQEEPDMEEDEATYSIIRHRFNGNNEVIKTGLSLEEAQEHCQRDDTRGDGWFDGYTEE
jgi:hypothetical protein